MRIGYLIILLLSSAAFAEDGKFNEHKQRILKEMDEQISALQSAKSCISSAADHEGMKHCHDELEKARKRHRAQELDDQIHHLQEEKEKLNKTN